jgi:RNA-directed DNA polymerase
MDFEQYSLLFIEKAAKEGYTPDEIEGLLDYANRLNQNNLPVIYDQEHFARLVGFKLSYLLAISNSHRHFYHTFKIPKRKGGFRSIAQPLPNLRLIQDWILNNKLNPGSSLLVHRAATAFMTGKSLYDNVSLHQGKNRIVALDIEDFFGNVKFVQVYVVFKRLGYKSDVSVLLAKLCTLRNALPQGAPTSPMLSNMVFYRIDGQLSGYCKRRGITYTRYADDLTFSGNNFKTGLLIRHVRYLINRQFSLNEDKTKIMGRANAQYVTGVVVNEKAQVPRKYRDRIRQEVYFIRQHGLEHNFSRVKGLPIWIDTPEVYLHHLIGKIYYVLQINSQDTEFVEYKKFLRNLEKQL